MNLNSSSTAFKGLIKVGDNEPLKTKGFSDDVLLMQLTNNLRRVGIDRQAGSVTMDNGLIIQPGYVVRHNDQGDTITLSVETGPDKIAEYVITNKVDPDLPDELEHKSVFAAAIEFIDKTIAKAKAKNNFLAGVDVKNVQDVFDAFHRKTY
ncbi:MAG: hypothetical protein AB7V50_10690 [Vampirovibrionia bacterium]